MSKNFSLPEMLADLERRVAFHREQEGVHAEHERIHREERARHAASLAQAAQQLAALQEAAAGAEALLREAGPLPDSKPVPPADPPTMVSRMVALVVQEWPAEASFGASAVAAEVDRRFAGTLGKPVSVPTVARTLLRLRKAGVVRTVRRGVSHAESLFAMNTTT